MMQCPIEIFLDSIGDTVEFVARIIQLLSLEDISLKTSSCSMESFAENLMGRSQVKAMKKDFEGCFHVFLYNDWQNL